MDLHLLIHLIQSLHKSLWLLLYTSPGSSAWLSLPCINMRKGYLVIPHHSTSFSNCLHSLVYRWLKVEHLFSYDVDLDTNGHFKSCYVRMHSISCKLSLNFFWRFSKHSVESDLPLNILKFFFMHIINMTSNRMKTSLKKLFRILRKHVLIVTHSHT